MNEPQRLVAATGNRDNDGVVSKLTSDLRANIHSWRRKRLVRLALRVAEEPILMLEVSQTPGFYWPVLMEHTNRIVIATSPAADSLLDAHRALSRPMTQRIRAMPGPLDYTELREASVDCILLTEVPQSGCNDANIRLLTQIRHVTRDTAILFARVSHQRPGDEAPQTCTCGAEPHAIDPASANARALEQEFLRLGFNQIRHYSFTPGVDGIRIYVLRK
ncbi:hypothetical protein JVX91_22595 [Pseudomonas sp. PDNC002]|uniref:hypothetical protein n=1 Tax=Pseudomonas sp. PDNC002 TaxID=2811422 RepID=UPI0019648B27|nr:hypothetical protein [Pseudomonas sp. PDNC002]QRY78349.1 hypothetical protein JVX91_22595 [Pseudomonas sp. PDNC002]